MHHRLYKILEIKTTRKIKGVEGYKSEGSKHARYIWRGWEVVANEQRGMTFRRRSAFVGD